MMILNEEKYARDVLTGRRDDVKSIRQKIDLIARYNHHVLNKNCDESYDSIVKWIDKHHDIFSEQGYSKIISDCIKKAAKRPFYHVRSVKITQQEMDVICAQNNLRYEKILFVLLCMAKVQKASYGFDNGLISYNITEVFKTARVSVPVDEREDILHVLLKLNLIGLPVKNDTKCLFIKFMDESEEDIVLELNEQDCSELAYVYLKYTGKTNIIKCSKCGKLIKQSKKFGNVCNSCRESSPLLRTVWCIDCGDSVYIDNIKDSRTCRCDQCNKKERRRINKQYYEKNKIKTDQIESTIQN